MSKWAGEENDWIQLMAQGPHRKEDVTLSLLATMRQAAEKRERWRRMDEETKRLALSPPPRT